MNVTYVNYLYCYPYKLEVFIALENIKTSIDNLKTCRAQKELNLTIIRFVTLCLIYMFNGKKLVRHSSKTIS